MEVAWLGRHVYLLHMLIESGNRPDISGIGGTDLKPLHVSRDYELNAAEPS
jgi:hypothetical protein